MMELGTPVDELTNVGKTTASRLRRLGIYHARDLLFHFPHRYEDWSKKTPIKEIRPYQDISIQGIIKSIKTYKSPRKRMKLVEALVEDETGSVKVLWFNQAFLVKTLPPGTPVSLSGKADLSGREVILKSPKYEVLDEQGATTFTGRILPMYPLSLNLTQKQMQFLTHLVLPLAVDIQDPLPEEIRQARELPHLSTALRWIHEPQTMEQVQAAQKRLAFEEVFYLHLRSAILRESNDKLAAMPQRFHEEEIKAFVQSLPFPLTGDQKKAAWKIFLDLQETKPMNRLLQGDVGSGKTIVAALAMLNTSLNGQQSALMAPTEVLAMQHFDNLASFFSKTDQSIAILTRTRHAIIQGSEMKYLSKQKVISLIAEGGVQIIVGTHALLHPDVRFHNLGLAVIDEQHRFGVEQRKILREHSGNADATPHLLSMTATPIPRTLSLMFYGDLAVSSLREMPQNRLPIQTKLVRSAGRQKACQFVLQEIARGGQVFVICPLIEESDKLGVTSVQQEYETLSAVFPNLRIAALHGKMKTDEKEAIISAFKEQKTDMLVSTTVIEVGIDIPNATVMLIEAAERFGLSQLHQIRGRVGRGEKQSYCFLFPSDETAASIGRLQRFAQCKNGFEVAELDLHIRGAGELLGTRQSGELELRFTEITDTAFIESVNDEAKTFLKNHHLEDFPLLAAHVKRMNEGVHLE